MITSFIRTDKDPLLIFKYKLFHIIQKWASVLNAVTNTLLHLLVLVVVWIELYYHREMLPVFPLHHYRCDYQLARGSLTSDYYGAFRLKPLLLHH